MKFKEFYYDERFQDTAARLALAGVLSGVGHSMMHGPEYGHAAVNTERPAVSSHQPPSNPDGSGGVGGGEDPHTHDEPAKAPTPYGKKFNKNPLEDAKSKRFRGYKLKPQSHRYPHRHQSVT